jgi:hypothetical protein
MPGLRQQIDKPKLACHLHSEDKMKSDCFSQKAGHKAISLLVILHLAFPPPVLAQISQPLPVPGALVPLSAEFRPVMLNGLTFHPENPLAFDFIVNTGHTKAAGGALKEAADKLIKYFLAALAVPEEELWVNLSP